MGVCTFSRSADAECKLGAGIGFGCNATVSTTTFEKAAFTRGDSASVPNDGSEVCPVAGSDKKGAVSATTATHTGDKGILFNLFCTSTHHVNLLAFQSISLSLAADSCLLREPALKLADRRFPHFPNRGGSGLCP